MHPHITWEISPVTKDDLPEEFSPKAVNTVDMFRRKTYDLDYECIIYFDIDTGDIVFCGFSDEDTPYKLKVISMQVYLTNELNGIKLTRRYFDD